MPASRSTSSLVVGSKLGCPSVTRDTPNSACVFQIHAPYPGSESALVFDQ